MKDLRIVARASVGVPGKARGCTTSGNVLKHVTRCWGFPQRRQARPETSAAGARFFHTLSVALPVAACLAIASGHAEAAPDGAWALCGAAFQLPATPPGIRTPEEARAADPEEIRLTADDADLAQGQRSVFTGNVVMEKGSEIIAADRAIYDESGQTLDAEGHVRYWFEELFLSGDRGFVEFSTDQIDLSNAAFMDLAAHARGTAEHVRISGSELIEIRNGAYTTCNPGDPDWMLEARKLDINQLTDIAVARDVKVRFKGYPIFYTPYLTFSLSDERKSGFLAPSFRVSGQAGAEVSIPYYFNLAPNYDATLRARLTTERGPLLGGEYRYLHTWGHGELDLEYVPYDLERESARGLVKYRHLSEVVGRWRGEIHYDRVSDRDYFGDFGDTLAVSSTTHLLQQATLDHWGSWWWGRARLESYQTVDPTLPGTSRPYQRLPQLLTYGTVRSGNRRVNVGYSGEYVHFHREDSVTGHRIDLFPYASFPVRTAGWYVVPTARLRYTSYLLSGVDPGLDDAPDRLVPTFSLDSGLFLERYVALRGRPFVSTLEPRAYYLAVPFDDQRDLPLFDTGQYTFNFSQLFREDRFSGADRMGDAHQLTLALTSRLLDPTTGGEHLRASIGQIFYFRDRRVTVSELQPAESRRSSDLVAEVSARLADAWSVKGGLQWNLHDSRTEKNAVGLRYQPDDERVANLTYRFVRDTVEQADASFRWPWRHNLSVVGRLNYSVDDNRLLETFGGIEYESCCWALRAVARRHLTNERGDYANAFFVQLVLKGLTNIGDRADVFLERSIPGYRNNF